MYKNYQNEMVFLSQEQKKAKQEEIMKKEKEASDLKRKYFGPEGELFKKRESLMSPIRGGSTTPSKEVSGFAATRSSSTGPATPASSTARRR